MFSTMSDAILLPICTINQLLLYPILSENVIVYQKQQTKETMPLFLSKNVFQLIKSSKFEDIF